MLPRLYEETDWILSRLGLMMGYTSASCVAMHMREMASVVRYEFTSAGSVVEEASSFDISPFVCFSFGYASHTFHTTHNLVPPRLQRVRIDRWLLVRVYS